MTSKPLIIAHRGASGHSPENTLKAFTLAHQMGAHGLELDVFLSKDHQLVVTHDRDLKRLTGVSGDVCGKTVAELRTLDFGEGERIPLLSEVFETCLPLFQVINVEIKSMGLRNNGIEEELARLIERFDCGKQILVSSFNPLHLWRFKRLRSQVRLGYLICKSQTILMRNRFMIDKIEPYGMNLEASFFHEPAGRSFFERAEPKWVWTVDEPEDLNFWVDQGVEAIMTNYPDRLKQILDSRL